MAQVKHIFMKPEPRKSPYVDETSVAQPPVSTTPTPPTKVRHRSRLDAYAPEPAKTEPTQQATAPIPPAQSTPPAPQSLGTTINLSTPRLSWRDRFEVAHLRGSEAVSRLIWMGDDTIVLLKPGMEFGELQNVGVLPNTAGAILDGFAAIPTTLGRLIRWPHLRTILVALLIFGGVFAFFNFPGILRQVEFSLNPPKGLTQGVVVPTPTAKAAPTQDFRILIPKLGVNAPVVLSTSRHWDQMRADLEKGVAHYSGTALPDEPGNVGLTGHSSNYWWDKGQYNYIFTMLDHLTLGDEITTYYAGKAYTYQVTGRKIVTPDQAEVLDPTPTRTLTLITCWPRYTNWKRLVVTATQIDPPQVGSTSGTAHLPSQ